MTISCFRIREKTGRSFEVLEKLKLDVEITPRLYTKTNRNQVTSFLNANLAQQTRRNSSALFKSTNSELRMEMKPMNKSAGGYSTPSAIAGALVFKSHLDIKIINPHQGTLCGSSLNCEYQMLFSRRNLLSKLGNFKIYA